ncbi:MAG: sulfotransferase [Pseudomonadota bacterium]
MSAVEREPAVSPVPIIIGGSHRSGTSLFRHLLNAHSGIFCPSEIKFHMDLLRQFPNDPLEFARLSASIDALGLSRDEWLDEFGTAFVRCFEKAATRAGKRRWADKNPENAVNIAHWRRLLGGRLFFILVVRHPLDVIASMADARMDRVIPTDVAGRADHISRFIRTGLEYCTAQPGMSYVLRYEALVEAPQATLSTVLPALGESFEPGMLEALKAPSGTPRGIEDPKVHRTRSVHASSVGRWRKDLSASDVKAAYARLQPLMDELGYGRD